MDAAHALSLFNFFGLRMRIPVWVFLFLFTVSGFAGLIYESIWSHYLKLFLGHAAYAQTLVLGIFMGGMALGSWLAGKYAGKIKQALLGYAIAELVIGLLALSFHQVFGSVTGWAFDTLIPLLGSPTAVELAKWSLAALLILPASILLGTTFPLMSTGIMRAYGDHGGRYLPLLYFTNSFGAAVGVLASGFVFIERFGLPGTIFTAGLLNVALAIAVWAVSKNVPDIAPPQESSANPIATSTDVNAKRFTKIMLLAAFVTGAASFMFEIAWIRMLSMAIGGSSHSFEVMLSAFILGIALGGLALGTIGNRFKNFPLLLAVVLSVKCVFAVGAVWVYPSLLDMVKWLYGGLARTESGYSLFVLGSYLVSGFMMIPAAFCAGMTLPLATRALLDIGVGEKSVGQIYAANTLGAIAGTLFATHVGMELLGVQGITSMGALLELIVACVILTMLARVNLPRLAMVVAPSLVLLLAFTFAFELDKLKMASGVYRFGQFMPEKTKVEFHKDGKTATISVLRNDLSLDIRTNGKTDAGIRMDDREKASTPDEHTMELAAVLPFLFVPKAETVANIGFGSGLTTHTVLGNPGVKRVDSVEIEAAMIEGARLFSPLNNRAYNDPRSNIHIDDAKTFFSANRAKYDIIISEPSNPWVSGVATLFSQEFYARIRQHIEPGGVLVQWIQLYDTKPYILFSVLKALGANFEDYVIYFAGPGDAMIIASPHNKLLHGGFDPFQVPAWRESLGRLGYSSKAEIELLRIGSRRALEPLVNSFSVRPNSDYFPIVDLNAPRERFLGASAVADFGGIAESLVPMVALIDGLNRPKLDEIRPNRGVTASADALRFRATEAALARDLSASLRAGSQSVDPLFPGQLRGHLTVVQMGMKSCAQPQAGSWVESLEFLLKLLAGSINAADNVETLSILKVGQCYKLVQNDGILKLRLELMEALLAHDMRRTAVIAPQLLALHEKEGRLSADVLEVAIQASLASALFQRDKSLYETVIARFGNDPILRRSLVTVALMAHLEVHAKTLK